MAIDTIFFVQFGVLLVLASCLAKWFAWPKLKGLNFYIAALPLLAVGVLRVTGLNFLNPNVTLSVPAELAHFGGYGDFTSALLALLALIAVRNKSSFSLFLTWLYIIFGGLDLLYGIWLGNKYAMPIHAGAFGLIIPFLVPAVIVSMYLLILVLLKNPKTK